VSRNNESSTGRPESRPEDPRRQPSRIRSPSPKVGSLSTRASGYGGPPAQEGRVRSASGGIQQQGSMRNRAASPQLGGMAQTGGVTASPPDPRERQQERPLQARTTPERQQERKDRGTERVAERAIERPVDRNVEMSTPDLSIPKPQTPVNGLTATPEDYSKEVESLGNRSPADAKHSETQHDEPSLQPSPQITSSTTNTTSPSIEQLKKRLAWATTELALAQSRGYIPNTESFDEDDDLGDFIGKNDFQAKDTKLLQALLSTRHQLSRVKELVKDQTRSASERIAEAERQRDEALSDAAYVRARLAAAQTGEDSTSPIQDDRAGELGKKLVLALSMQNELSMKVEGLTNQLAAEHAARKQAEEMCSTHLEKFEDLERRRNEHSLALEEMRGKFHEAQRAVTDERTKSIDHEALVANLRIETAELKRQVGELTGLVEHQQNAVKATKTAVQTAVERAEVAERELYAERTQRLDLAKEVVSLKQQLAAVETQQSKLDLLERQLSQAREEADAARLVMLSGLDNLSPQMASDATDYEGRLQTMQGHLDATKSLHAESREAHEVAVQELAKANERVAALEASQSEHIKEIANLQSQLSQSIDQLQSLQGEYTKVRTKMTELQRDLDASYAKHSAIKQLFSERPASASPLRSITATPEVSNRIRELERQLEESTQLREELEANQDQVMQNLSVAQKRHKDATRRQREAEDRVKTLEEEIERTSAGSATASAADIVDAQRKQAEAEKKLADSTVVFQDRLAQLESDYQSAVHYVKGTEKMIRRMKEELTKYKSQNAFLQTELHDLKRQSFRGETVIEWETEKERLVKEIENLQVMQKSDADAMSDQIKSLQSRLDKHNQERDTFKAQLSQVQKELDTASERSKQLEAELTRLKNDDSKSQLENELIVARATAKRLEQENQQLESRATEAEEKVSHLLDQVETSVDTYRRSIIPKRTDGTSPPISPRSSSVGNRTSVALDSLAHELDQLRSHWESSSHRYRLSTTSSLLDRESPTRGLTVNNPADLGLSPFDFNTSKVTMSSDDPSVKVNGVHELSSRWHDELDKAPSSHLRQVTA